MNQKELRELERRCIQEEPPTCTARCPIHVDVRSFLNKMAQGKWDDALQILAVTMPFPGILGRICDHPCEPVCRRAEAGGSISISDLERTAVARGRARKRQPPIAQKESRVAIVGTGLSSLTAAWDLAHKGYRVTIFEDPPIEPLQEISEKVLPREIVNEEMNILKGLGVVIIPSPSMKERGWIHAILSDFDALYVGLDSESISGPGNRPEECMPLDPLTLASSHTGLFAGGTVEGATRAPATERPSENSSHSEREGKAHTALPGEGATRAPVIEAVAQGRRAAISIDRFLQRVSLTAAREKEGPYQSRLFTNLKGVKPEPPIPMEDPSGYNETEAKEEAKRCFQCECMECVKQCIFMQRFKGYPKRYVRQISNDATMVLGSHGPTRKLVNSCSLCGLCTVICPNAFPMAEICLEGRMSLVKGNKMPPSPHDFALEDMRSANSEKSAPYFHEPGKDQSAFVFFPGCQLGAVNPDHVISSYAYLRRVLKGGVGLILKCCGAPAKWAAREDLFQESLTDLTESWERLGRPVIITACPTCYQILKEHLPESKLTTLWQMLDDSVIDEHSCQGTFAVHDPCTTRHEPAMQQSIRHILARLGCTAEELSLSREKTECCGFGGLMSASNPSLARDQAKIRSSRSETDYVTYCAMCVSALASSGKRVFHILDLLFGTEIRNPGLSERRENRHRLVQKLVKELGGAERPMNDYERIVLYISPEVRALMEERRILTEDVQKTIDHAERSGTKLFNPDLGHYLSSFTPSHVTYWVEYSPEGKGIQRGFRVHTAYCHRMEIAGGGK